MENEQKQSIAPPAIKRTCRQFFPMDTTTLLLVLVLLLFVISLGISLLKFIILPKLVKHAIEIAPLDKEPLFNKFNLQALTEAGCHVSFEATVPETKLLIPFLWVKATIPSIRILDAFLGDVLVDLYLSDPIIANGQHDLKLSQSVHVDLCDNTEALKGLTNKILIGGQKEVERLTLRLQFKLSLSIMDLFFLENLDCGKTINIKEVQDLKARLQAMKPMDYHVVDVEDITKESLKP